MPSSKASSSSSADGRTWILYDADCGVCRVILAAILAWDRAGRLKPLRLQSALAAELLPGMSEEERMRSFHLVEPGGAVHSAGAGLSAMFDELPGGKGLAAASRRFDRATSRAYWLVARNRTKLGKLVPNAAREKSKELIARREPT